MGMAGSKSHFETLQTSLMIARHVAPWGSLGLPQSSLNLERYRFRRQVRLANTDHRLTFGPVENLTSAAANRPLIAILRDSRN